MAIKSDNPPQIITLEGWAGINQSSSRPVIDDQECWWLENLFPVAPGHLRSAWGPSAPIYTATPGAVIRRIFFTNIDGVNPLGFMFLDSGGIGLVDQVNLNTGEVTGLGPVWQPVAPHYWADLKLWQPNQFGNVPGQNGGVLIGSPQGLYAWDGAMVSRPGDNAPLWLTNGRSTDASGNQYVMPVGLPGIYAMEVYDEVLWVMGQTVVAFSAASVAIDFSATGGGGAFPYHGDQLTVSRTDLHQTAGYLYLFNDSSTDLVSRITYTGTNIVSGSVGTVTSISTQFQLTNNDPQIGQRFFRPVGVWEQAFTLFNGSGIYVMSGATVQWASQKITNLLNTLDPSTIIPTQCAAHIHGKKWLLYNAMLTDVWGVKRSMILCWSGPGEGKWVIASQRLNLTSIASYEQNSCITPYGTDGMSLYQLFAQPDPSLQKRLTTKLYNGLAFSTDNAVVIKTWKRLYLEWMDQYRGGQGVYFTGTMETWGGGIPNGREDVSFSLEPSGYDITPAPVAGQGINAGVDLLSYSPDFTVARLTLTFDPRTLFGA